MSDLATLLAASGLSRLEAALLAGHVLGRGRAWIAAHGDAQVGADDRAAIETLFARRRAGEPVAYLLGGREFHGLELLVGPQVLIPRPETELLVDLALARIPPDRPARVVDLGTGSGAVAVAIALARPLARITAVELSGPALQLARANALRHGAAIEFLQGDWFEPLAGREFDLVISNPPYVAEGDVHLDEGDVRHEPRLALAGGADGTAALRVIARSAPAHLAAGGWLLMEHGYDQRDAMLALMRECGYEAIDDVADLAGQPRVILGRRAGPSPSRI